MSRQHGNEIDEFVTHVLRNQLVGIPLDLAALNIARGRDLGLPSLNEARAQFYQMSGQDSQLKPYVSWTDFALNLQNPLSIVNFIAAYGKHDLIAAATTMEGKRAAASLLIFGGTGAPADRLDFLNSEGTWASKESGLNDIDLWMGGLAEKKMDFGGMLGLDLLLRLRGAVGEPPGCRPVLLPLACSGSQPPERAREQLDDRHHHAQHRPRRRGTDGAPGRHLRHPRPCPRDDQLEAGRGRSDLGQPRPPGSLAARGPQGSRR